MPASKEKLFNDWAAAQINPFECDLAPVPLWPGVPVTVHRNVQQATIAIGSNRWGYATMGRILTYTAAGGPHDEETLGYVTNSNYTSSTGTIQSASSTQHTRVHWPAEAGTDPVGHYVRTVAYGMRVRFRGPADECGGEYYIARAPAKGTVIGTDFPGQLEQLAQDQKVPITPNDWCTVTWAPETEEELRPIVMLDYDDNNWPFTDGQSEANQPLGIGIRHNKINETQDFEVEFAHIYELVPDTPDTDYHNRREVVAPIQRQRAYQVLAQMKMGGLRICNPISDKKWKRDKAVARALGRGRKLGQ